MLALEPLYNLGTVLGDHIPLRDRWQLYRNDTGAATLELEGEETRRRADVQSTQPAHVHRKVKARQELAKVVVTRCHYTLPEIDGVIPVVARDVIEPPLSSLVCERV